MLRTLILTFALVCGASAAVLVNMIEPKVVMADNASQALVPVVPMTQVLIAARDITEGTALTEEDLIWAEWPEPAVNPAYASQITSPDAAQLLLGQISRLSYFPGQPLLPASFAETRDGFLAALLSPGQRAVAIQVSAAKTAGGFILPNNRVDVLLTMPCDDIKPCSQRMVTQTILQNVRVLAIDQSGGKPDNDNAVLIGKTATLELNPTDAEVLISAEASGILSLLLRGTDDMAVTPLARAEDIAQDAGPSRTIKINRAGISEVVSLQ